MSNESERASNTESDKSKRERLFLSLSDFLMLAMILFDLLYWGGLLTFEASIVIFLNIATVIIGYIAYELKKRIKKRAIRRRKNEMDSTSL